LVSTAAVNAVEPIVIDLEFGIATDLQLVRDSPGLDAGKDRLVCLQVLVGELEAVIPERVLAGAQLLALLPRVDPIVVPAPALQPGTSA
jgi:hypothetical protein